ncbi:MAG: metallopeptidase TldD-related protein [Promethearchaeota archaeon]
MSDREELLRLAIKVAGEGGATETIARIKDGDEYQIRFSNSAIDVSKQWNVDLMEVFISNNGQISLTEVLAPTPDKVREVVSSAAKFVSKLPMNPIFAGIEEQKRDYTPIPGLFDPGILDFHEVAPGLVNESVASALESGADTVAGVLYFGHQDLELLTSCGVGGSYRESHYQFTIRSFVDAESSGQENVVGRDLHGLEEKFREAGESAGRVAKMAVGGRQGEPGKYDLILGPAVAANLFGMVSMGANPLLMMIGMSPLKDEDIGTQIAASDVTVVDDSRIPEGLASRPFDAEGTPTGKTTIVEGGVFKGVVHNTSSSEFKGTSSTGNSEFFELDEAVAAKFLAPVPTNVVFQGGPASLEEMIEESTKPTIYVTNCWYTRFTNQIEGTFSTIPRDGMFLIEGGEVKRPVRKLRLADNILRMAKDITRLGNDVRQVKWWEVMFPTFIPTIKVKDCTMTSATQ